MYNYKDLEVWQKSKELARETYLLTQSIDRNHFDLISQIRKSTISIPSNIAEGVGRGHDKETLHHLYISRGSLYELETQLILAYELNIFKEEIFKSLSTQIESVRRLLQAFIQYYLNKK
ncbi:MAG: four helix bundle protein [Ignavibacteriaceae bacterium]|nr:four helix bundle protein [Ignavibacteriaceae bacterium]